ncbi:MAG: ribosomal-processing cysteine protease Prp [Lachnospiraceae bacterium]|nr:ribosomal-processing cysteine protease Prp [Lachnospiraceae bacterium]
MTTITIYKSENGTYKRFTCDGHAGYADYGKDIVCASVSCLVINTINSMDELVHEKMEITTNEKKGLIDCRFCGEISSQSRLLMDSLILGLKGIVSDYGKKYLELKFKEV